MNPATGQASTGEDASGQDAIRQDLVLILFDMDGTLIDGAPAISAAMGTAFADIGRPAPADGAVRAVIGLDLEEAIRRIEPSLAAREIAAAAEAYRRAFVLGRAEGRGEAASPLYPGLRQALDRLAKTEALLGVATGKSRRGLDVALEAHDLRKYFVTAQCASEGPGKPHPAMIERALAETGADAGATVMVGDATYDMEMARAAGARAIGVSWGYHPPEALRAAGAETVIEAAEQLEPALDALLGAGWRGAAAPLKSETI